MTTAPVPFTYQLRAIRPNQIAPALPHLRSAHQLQDVLQQFTAWAYRASTVENFGSWQAAWNRWTRATVARPGVVRIVARCDRCNGRGIDMRRGQVCRECAGRRSTTISTVARHIPAPKPSSG